MEMNSPRIMIAAPSSGSGKTVITCGILQALLDIGKHPISFKCGPDYIDPLFHEHVLHTKSRNLDTFFTDAETTRYLYGKTAKDGDISVIEGVMGYYDGVGGTTLAASSYDLASTVDAPVILVINGKGMSLSLSALIGGFLHYQADSRIKGVILNQVSPMLYEKLKQQIEADYPIEVLGYVPVLKELTLESRHLGLILPDEVKLLRKQIELLAETLKKTVEIKRLIEIAESASKMDYRVPEIKKIEGRPRIALARDSAFCFYYEDNLELLRQMGAEIVEFSPIKDAGLPEQIDGLLLGGGYPELYARELSENTGMRKQIKAELERGLPCIAECGGFLYLHNHLEGKSHIVYPMVGAVNADGYRTDRLNHFGYITVEAAWGQLILEKGEQVRAHEFHYWNSTDCGNSCMARKPVGNRSWQCGHGSSSLSAGFPHFYYYSNLEVPYRFLQCCMAGRDVCVPSQP